MKKLLILLFSTSLSTFADSQLDYSLSDFCYQQPGVQDRGGVYYFPNEKEGISASSLCIYKDLYGQYMDKVELVNGKFDGQFIRWWENGSKHQEKKYINGKLDGKWTEWWSDGRIYFEKNYIDDTLITETDYTYYDNGQLALKGTYKDGNLDGKLITWYENGQIKSEKNYKDGKLDGEFKKWDENGQESQYKDGKLHGIVDRHDNGQIKSILYYSKDFWNGNYEGWHDNGIKSYKGTFYLQKFNAVSEHTNWDRNGNVESFGQYNIESFRSTEDKGLDTARKIGTWTYIIDGEEVEVKDEWTYFKEPTLKEGE